MERILVMAVVLALLALLLVWGLSRIAADADKQAQADYDNDVVLEDDDG